MVLVTGSSRGIGKAIAEEFIRKGEDVILHGMGFDSPRRLGEFDGNMGDLVEYMGATDYIVGDLSKPDIIPTSIARNTHTLINCAGGDIGHDGVNAGRAGKPWGNDPISISYLDMISIIDRNFISTVNTCQSIVPFMMEKEEGCIINIGSMNVNLKLEESSIYSAMKAGVHHYTRSLSTLCRPFDIQVNCVAPGGTLSPRFKASRDVRRDLMGEDKGLIRYGTMEEVASAVYKVSTIPFMTGQIITIDGGMS